jgi:outer membrane protein TolC
VLLLASTSVGASSTRPLSLKEAVRTAVRKHPDIAEIAADRAAADIEVSRRTAQFSPVFALSPMLRDEHLFTEYAEQSPVGLFERTTLGAQASLSGRSPFGGAYALLFQDRRIADTSDVDFVRLNPRYESRLGVRWAQPLWRGAGYLGGLVELDQARLAFRVADAEIRSRLQTVIADVVRRYWELALRIEAVKILETNVGMAEKLRKAVEGRIKHGAGSPVDLAQADATLAARRKDVQIAKLQVIDAERALLAASYLLSAEDVRWDEQIVPTDEAKDEPVEMNLDAHVKVAMGHRPEVQRADESLRLARLNLDVARSQSGPRVDLVAEAGVSGMAGTSVVRSTTLSILPPGALVRGDNGTALGNMISGVAPYYQLGLELELPIDNADRRGAAQQAEYAVKKAEAERSRAQVALDVRAALQRIAAASERVRLALETEKFANENVDAERRKFEVGASTPFDVLRTQDELSRARAEVFASRIERTVAISVLDVARGTLVERYGVTFEEVADAPSH